MMLQRLQRATDSTATPAAAAKNLGDFGHPAGLTGHTDPGAAQEAARAVAAGGEPMPQALRRDFEARFGHSFNDVRFHRSGDAQAAARSINARAFTLGNHIAFGAGQFSPATESGRRLIAHELTHSLQQRSVRWPIYRAVSAIQRQPTSLAAIPLRERQRIHVSTIPITITAAQITSWFRAGPGGQPGTRLSSARITYSYATGIAAGLRVGLRSVGTHLALTTNGLPLNSSIEVELDLTAYSGAHRRYRFTRFTHNRRRGRRTTPTEVLLIEDVGAAVATAARATVPRQVTLGTNTYPLRGTWSAGEYAILHQALSLLPAAARTAANGVTFQRIQGILAGAEPGRYDEVHDRIEIFSNAFPAATVSTRFGGQPPAVRTILHEIGHALDLRPLQAAWRRFQAAGSTAASRAQLQQRRSLSGSRMQVGAGGLWTRAIHRPDRSPAFRHAVRQDGVRDETRQRRTPEGTTATLRRGVTTYSDTDYEELFAESFMLYISDRPRLQQLRPHTYAYFLRRYP